MAKIATRKKLRIIEGGAAKKGGSPTKDAPPWDEDEDPATVVKSYDVSAGRPKHESDEDEEALSLYAKRLRRLAKRVSNKSKTYNSALTRETVVREQLASVLRLLPLAEESFMGTKSERQAYAYMALMNQSRELMADLQSMATVDELAANIVQKVIEPTYTELISFLIGEISQVQSEVNNATSKEQLAKHVRSRLSELLKIVGTFAQESMEKASEESVKALRG